MARSRLDMIRASTPRLEVVGLSRSYGETLALDRVDVSVAPGEIHALCGHNGAGKSTLVNVVSGLVTPDQGSVLVDGRTVALRSPQEAQRCGIAVVDQEISLIPVLSVAENLLLGRLDAPFINSRAKAAAFVARLLDRVGLAGLPAGTRVERLSLGQRQLVEIARALGRDPRILVLDEPTATLGDAEIAHVFAAVRAVAAHGTSVIFVSHRLGEVLSLCDAVTVLRDGRRVACAPAIELDRGRLIGLMLGNAVSHAQPRPAGPSGDPSLIVEQVAVAGRVRGVSFGVRRGEIVALAGQVGSGASEILRALAGLTLGVDGEVSVGGRRVDLSSPVRAHRAGINYLSNDRKGEGLFLSRSVARNVIATRLGALGRHGLLRPRLAKRAAASLVTRVGLSDRERDPVAALSGGNQQKAFLGRCLERDAAVLLLDEPTRGVDVGGRAAIHTLIRSAAADGSAVVFASTELDEILELADVIVTLCGGRVGSIRPRSDFTSAQLASEMTHIDEPAVPA